MSVDLNGPVSANEGPYNKLPKGTEPHKHNIQTLQLIEQIGLGLIH